MDCKKSGALIRRLRLGKDMTQSALADRLGVSVQAVSKWERGLGYPDVSLINDLSSILGVDAKGLLCGELSENACDSGNMKRIKFFVCPECGAVFTGTGNAELSCCGRKLEPLKAQKSDNEHTLSIERADGGIYLTFDHAMTKEHHIAFIAYVNCDRVLLVRLYPEQSPEVLLPALYGGRYYFYCTKHGLFVK